MAGGMALPYLLQRAARKVSGVTKECLMMLSKFSGMLATSHYSDFRNML